MNIVTLPTTQSAVRQPRRLFTRLKRILLTLLHCRLCLAAWAQATKRSWPPAMRRATRRRAGWWMSAATGWHISCMGAGAPTVVLASGAGGFSAEWSLVQPELSKATRVCAFDRAGLGWSEPGSAPRSPAHIADELHTLLTNAGIKGPIVLVAHSAGGKHARLYAQRHPERVAGIVLVDARSEYVDDHLTPEQAAAERADFAGFQSQIATLSRFGVIRLIWAWGWPKALPVAAKLAPETRQLIGILQARSQHQATSLSETEAARLDNDALRGARFGATPLVVLASGQLMHQILNWRESQEYQVGLSTNSRLIVAEGSDHSIHWDRPALVIRAVRAAIDAARTGHSLAEWQYN